MKTLLPTLMTCALVLAGMLGLSMIAYAHSADAVRTPEHPLLAMGMAGPSTSPIVIPDAPAPAPDPIDNPTGAIETVQTAWASGRYALAVVLTLWVLARLGYGAAVKWPSNFFVRKLRLGNDKVRAVLVAGTGIAAAAAASLAASGRFDWRALAGALAAAVALYLSPTPQAPAKEATPA